ncbi:biotin--[acetyl-CoA-carboxylase] ligase [bacterium]
MKFLHFTEVDSTNIYALKNINNLKDKTVVFADTQTAGKGRNNRRWISGFPNNLYMSVVLKPSYSLEENFPLFNITQYMAVVVCRLLALYQVDASIKWPNDILVNDKKIAGILSETCIQGNELQGMIVGLGVNLNMTNESLSKIDQRAVSLNILLGKSISRDEFLHKLLDLFFFNYNEFLEEGFSCIKDEYKKKAMFLNKHIKINAPSETFYGIAKDIDETGALILETNGRERLINVGDLIC